MFVFAMIERPLVKHCTHMGTLLIYPFPRGAQIPTNSHRRTRTTHTRTDILQLNSLPHVLDALRLVHSMGAVSEETMDQVGFGACVCVSLCVCVRMCMCVLMYVSVCAHVQLCVCVRRCLKVRCQESHKLQNAHTHTHKPTHTRTHTNQHTRAHTQTNTHTRTHTNQHTRTLSQHTQTQTHVHTLTDQHHTRPLRPSLRLQARWKAVMLR